MKSALKLIVFCLVTLTQAHATSGMLVVYGKNGRVATRCNGTVVTGGAVITKANCIYDFYKKDNLSHIEFYPDYKGDRDYNNRAFRAIEVYVPNDYIYYAKSGQASMELMQSNFAIVKMYRDDTGKWLRNSNVPKSLFARLERYPNFDHQKRYPIYMASHLTNDGEGIYKERYNCEVPFGRRFIKGVYPTTCKRRKNTGEGAYLYHEESGQVYMVGLITGGYDRSGQLLTTFDNYYDSMDSILALGFDTNNQFEKIDFTTRSTYSISFENDCLAIDEIDITIVATNSLTGQKEFETIRRVEPAEIANFNLRTHTKTWYYYAKASAGSHIYEWGNGDDYYKVDGVAKPFTKKSLKLSSSGEGTWINQRQRLSCTNF